MFVSNDQLQALAGAGEDQFLQRLTAHQAEAFPQLPLSSLDSALPQATAMAAVAQFHGFSNQQDIAICSDCVVPFTVGGANPAAIQEAGNQPLQTLVSDTKSVLSRLNASALVAPPSAGDLSALKRQCAFLATTTGSTPLNTDRSGSVVPFREYSPVKPADLTAAAQSALPRNSSRNTGITQEQLIAAVVSAQETFPKTAPVAVVQSCKPVLADLEFRRVYWDGTPMPKIPYTVTLADGSKRSGTTDSSGLGSHTGVPPGQATVVYGGDKNPAQSSVSHEADSDIQQILGFRTGSQGGQS